MNTRTSLFRRILLILVSQFSAAATQGEEPSRVLELSTRGVPLIGEISFLKEDGTQVGRPVEVRGERFIWRQVPPGSVKFTVRSLANTSPPADIQATGHTFAALNPTQPLDPTTLNQGANLKRLPLIEPTRSLAPLPVGSQGWIFVGTLSADFDDSEWNSLYILNESDGMKPDKTEKFTFASFRMRVAGSDSTLKLFIADFPLKIRSAASTEATVDAPILRPGQKVEISEVVRSGTAAYAKITVK